MICRRVGFVLALSTAALAQESPPTTTRTVPQTGQPTQPEDLRGGMRSTGGSLFQAQGRVMPMGTAGQPIPLTEFERASVFAVPAPQPRVLRKNDLVTVIIREQSDFKSSGSTELKKDASLEAALNEFITLNLASRSLEPLIGDTKPRIDLSGKMDFSGDGKVDRKDEMSARLTAVVVDVRPNDTIVLAARKRIKNDDEEQLFLVSGVARAIDVTADNTILSTQMYDLDLRKEHQGTVRNATRRGWLPKLLDAINPF